MKSFQEFLNEQVPVQVNQTQATAVPATNPATNANQAINTNTTTQVRNNVPANKPIDVNQLNKVVAQLKQLLGPLGVKF